MFRAVRILLEHMHDLPCASGLSTILPRALSDASYKFFAAEDEAGGPLIAAGLMTFFRQPMADINILAVEALWFEGDNLSSQLPVWRALVEFCRKAKFGAVCVSPSSTNAQEALQTLVVAGVLEGAPITLDRCPLQKVGNPSPVWTAFAEEPITDAAFISSPVITVHTEKVIVDVSGRELAGAGSLYRGEGRLECSPYWHCADLDQLITVHFAKGVHACKRELAHNFNGTIKEQILHQAAVAQGAVSLSTSFEVAARYATHRGRRDEGVVFLLDTERVRNHTRIFDAMATLVAACPWIPSEAWTPLRGVVRQLSLDVVATGDFLERCFEDSFARARVGAGSLMPRREVFEKLSSEARASLAVAGVSQEESDRVLSVFGEFAELALQRVGSADVLHLGEGSEYTVETKRVGPMAYFEMFASVRETLQNLPRANRGLDLTPFGYIAKTLRDDECLASGSIPGKFIVEALVVDRVGAVVRRVKAALSQ